MSERQIINAHTQNLNIRRTYHIQMDRGYLVELTERVYGRMEGR